jgi:hypothetical protein
LLAVEFEELGEEVQPWEHGVLQFELVYFVTLKVFTEAGCLPHLEDLVRVFHFFKSRQHRGEYAHILDALIFDLLDHKWIDFGI